MELSISGRQRRAVQISNSQAKPEAKANTVRNSLLQSQTDRLALSRQALAMLEERNRQEQEAKAREIEEKKRSGRAELDAATKALKTMMLCQKIAARIMAGDKVPPEDERFLMENDSTSYKLAMAMRKPKEDPKEWDSVLEEEEESGSSGSGEEAVEVSASVE